VTQARAVNWDRSSSTPSAAHLERPIVKIVPVVRDIVRMGSASGRGWMKIASNRGSQMVPAPCIGRSIAALPVQMVVVLNKSPSLKLLS
jgi:hypothetical protein